MQNDTNEFVFKRKRKRLRINVQDTETVISLGEANDGLRPGPLIPEIAVLPEPAMSSPVPPEFPKDPNPGASSENMVTVETFLRRSAQTSPITNQAVRGHVAPRKPRAYAHRRPAEWRTSPVRRVAKVPKRSKKPSRIAKALFRAAVLTDVDPLDTVVDGSGTSLTRRPLKFVPFNKFTSPLGLGKIDPVKPSDAGRGENAVLHTRRPGNPSDLKAHHRHSSSSDSRTPLCLVPLREAEAAYSVMFP